MLRRIAFHPFVLLVVAASFGISASASTHHIDGQTVDVPITGQADPDFAGVDAAVLSMMSQYQIPGAELGVVHDGRLVYARGYGYADRDHGVVVQPNSRFRIASITKPILVTATLRLVEQGRIGLDLAVFPYLGLTGTDPRTPSITVRDLIEHKGGWDRSISGDPMFNTAEIAHELGVASPADCPAVTRWMLQRPLDFTPGTRAAYSNFGYCVLGLVDEKATGASLADLLQQEVLGPLGMSATALGSTLHPLPGEVHYYDYPGAPSVASVFNGVAVPAPYGGFSLETMAANGGLVSTAPDLLRFLVGTNGSQGNLLGESFQDFGLDFGEIPPVGPGWTWAFEGSLAGTRTVLAMDSDTGNGYALLTNTWRTDTSFDEADPLLGLRTAVNAVSSWPSGNLFGSQLGPGYGYSVTVTIQGVGGTVASDPAGISCPGTCTTSFPPGTKVTLTPSAAKGSSFAGWSGGGCSGTADCAVTVNSDLGIKATFAKSPSYTLRVTVTNGGAVKGLPNGQSCLAGRTCQASGLLKNTHVRLAAAAAKNWHFRGWSGACHGKGLCALTVRANLAVTASFSRNS